MKKILLDTNILVPLEDNRVVPEAYSTLLRKLAQRTETIYIHRASFDDVGRDKDSIRREQSLSKLAKYPVLEKSDRTIDQLSFIFGSITSVNDEADCHILSALADFAVEALITEDNDIHRRARMSGFHDRVFRVKEMLDDISDQEANTNSTLTFVESKYCYQINKDDPIFQSLESDYNNFRKWWQDKCCSLHRQCWIVRDQQNIAGIVVYNDESDSGGDGKFDGKKVLKICTFKVSETHRGGRLGEQLLKQSLWFATSNQYQVVYLTVFPKQQSLIDLLSAYGFQLHSCSEGELIYAKDLVKIQHSEDEYDWHLLNYPRLKQRPILSVVVPIQSQFHKRLIPEASTYRKLTTPDFFEGVWSNESKDHHIPATSIRKVYVCKAVRKEIPRGTRLYFYVSKNDELEASQCISAVGVLEEYREILSVEELFQATAKRSVYRRDELHKIFANGGKTKLLNFIIVGMLEKPISLASLKSSGILTAPPQSIVNLDAVASEKLSQEIRLVHLS